MTDLIYAVVIESVFRSNVTDGHIQMDEFNYFLLKNMILDNWPLKKRKNTHVLSRLAQDISHSYQYLCISGFVVFLNLVLKSVHTEF